MSSGGFEAETALVTDILRHEVGKRAENMREVVRFQDRIVYEARVANSILYLKASLDKSIAVEAWAYERARSS